MENLRFEKHRKLVHDSLLPPNPQQPPPGRLTDRELFRQSQVPLGDGKSLSEKEACEDGDEGSQWHLV